MPTASPSYSPAILGAVATALLLVAAWRRDRRALLLWGSVLVYVVVTVVLVAYGRFALFGDLFTVHYHYWSDLSIPLTVAVVLTTASLRIRLSVAVCCLLAWTVGIVVSDAGFAGPWAKNPAKAYFATVAAEFDRAGPNVNLWDTSMPQPIVNGLTADLRLSPVLRVAGIPFQLQSPASEPLMVDETGHLRPARLAVWSRGEPPSRDNPFCNLLLHGTEPLTIPLRPTQPEVAIADWFVKAAYFSNRENDVTLELIDADGNVAALPAARWPAGLGNMYFGPSKRIRTTEVRLRSSDPGTNLCLENLEIGLPQVSG
jgi:hypothetical protein